MSRRYLQSQSTLIEFQDDCELWENLTKKMLNAYELVAFPKRSDPLFYDKTSEIAYLNEKVFPTLLPAMMNALQLAKKSESLKVHRKTFNGLDKIAEYLWRNNPKYRYRGGISLFRIPFVKKYLKENPRPPYSLSNWLTVDEAATIIQAYIRGHFVRRIPSVQEMRSFWKAYKKEKMEAQKQV